MVRINRRGALLLAGAAAGGALLAAVSLRRPAREALPVTIARLKTPHAGLVHIAEAQGLFTRHGVPATMVDRPTGLEAMTEMFERRADFATPAETPVARALAEGRQPRVIATLFTSHWNSGIVARRDRGIAQPADLRGKRIGFVFGTATHYMLETFLAFHGIPLESVTLVRHKPTEMEAALTGGEVDAASIWTPYLTHLQRALGERSVLFSPREFYAETCNLVVRADYVRSERERVDRVLQALADAEDFARRRPDDALAIVARVSGVEPEALRGHGDPLTFELTLQQSLLLALENEVRWYLRRGLVPPRAFPDVLAAIETDPLRTVRPGAVGIAR